LFLFEDRLSVLTRLLPRNVKGLKKMLKSDNVDETRMEDIIDEQITRYENEREKCSLMQRINEWVFLRR
jgi:hypothetical protein